ncbi:MAG: phage tail tape measure C-terminal domain-containing protein [Alphaproteobacteria bacterium]|nr:phage tail tape measure C-terminal domain-containing protein [Alphaproteobacteria bacterium]
MTQSIAVRLVVDGGKAKAEMVEFGKTGKKSLNEIVKSGKPASNALKAVGAAANDVKGSATGLAHQIGPLGSGLAAIGPAGLAAAAALAVLTLGLKSVFSATMEEEKVQNRLQGVLKATGYAAGLTKKDMVDLADEIEKTTLASSEDITGAAAIMATFRSVSGDTFKKSIRLAQDMTSVFGNDLRSAATQLGKALEDPVKGVSALSRVGVTFSDAQKEVIARLVETGKQAEAQKIILDALEGQVGGSGRAESQGLTGATHSLSVAWDDMLKTIGKTETVGGTAETILNRLASTFRFATEVISQDPLDRQLSDARKELAEIEKELVRIRDIPAMFQVRGNVANHEERADELRNKIASLEKSIEAERKEKEQAEAGRKAAEAARVHDLIDQRAKPYAEAVEKFLEKDPSYQIKKLNDELKQTEAFLDGFRTDENGAQVDKAIETARKAIGIKIANIEDPLAAAAEKEAAANQKIVDDLKEKLLGLTDERKIFIDEAVARLSEKATDAQREQTAKLAGQLFDEKAFLEAQKVVDGLNDNLKELWLTARQLSIKEAVDALPDTASPARIAQVRDLAGAYFDQKTAQEQLDKLREEGKSLTDEAKTATELYAEKIEHLNQLLDAGAISQGIYNKALAGADEDLLSSRLNPAAGVVRAFQNYKDSATDTATTIENAFTEAMGATEDAIVNMVTSGEISLKSLSDLASSVVEDITRMLVKQSITMPLFNSLTGSGSSSGGFLGSIVSAFFHEGGTVGDPTSRRAVPAHVFAGAPRYHSGGIAGLKPDEVPAILQRGEEVISKKDRSRRSSGVSLVMNISTPDANSFRASQGQIVAKAAKRLNRAKRNM